jgi:membrane protein implicated in regulation of membrane protease activity
VTSLFGRNPVAMAVVGAALLAIGLATHSHFMPWIGSVLLAVGGVKTAIGWRNRGPGDGKGEDRSVR